MLRRFLKNEARMAAPKPMAVDLARGQVAADLVRDRQAGRVPDNRALEVVAHARQLPLAGHVHQRSVVVLVSAPAAH